MLARNVGSAEVFQLLILPLGFGTLYARTSGLSAIVLVDELMAALVPGLTQLSAHVGVGVRLIVLHQFC